MLVRSIYKLWRLEVKEEARHIRLMRMLKAMLEERMMEWINLEWGTFTRFNVQRTMMNQYKMMSFWLMKKVKRAQAQSNINAIDDENYIWRNTKINKTVEIDQVNSRFVLLLRWMKISLLLKERKKECLLLFWLIWIYGNMKPNLNNQSKFWMD